MSSKRCASSVLSCMVRVLAPKQCRKPCSFTQSQRQLQTTSVQSVHASEHRPKPKPVRVVFKSSDGDYEVYGQEGDSLLDLVVNKNVPLDGFGACEGTMACSTCHVIMKQEDYDRLPEEQTDEELDMLDLAIGITDTSRLGCQVILTKDMDGLEVTVPSSVVDARTQ